MIIPPKKRKETAPPIKRPPSSELVMMKSLSSLQTQYSDQPTRKNKATPMSKDTALIANPNI